MDDTQRIAGTWRLISVEYQDVATGERSLPSVRIPSAIS